MKKSLILLGLGCLGAIAPIENRIIPRAEVVECQVGNRLYREVKGGPFDDLEIFQKNGYNTYFLVDRFSLVPEHDEVFGARADHHNVFSSCNQIDLSNAPGCVVKDKFYVRTYDRLDVFNLGGEMNNLESTISLVTERNPVIGSGVNALIAWDRYCTNG